MTNFGKYITLKITSFLCFAMPIFAVIAVNYESFIYVGAKYSLYFYVALLILAVEFSDSFLKITKKNPALVMSFALFITSVVMRYFSDQLLLISIAGIVGGVISVFFKEVEKVYFHACYEVLPNGDKMRKTEEVIPLKTAIRRAYF